MICKTQMQILLNNDRNLSGKVTSEWKFCSFKLKITRDLEELEVSPLNHCNDVLFLHVSQTFIQLYCSIKAHSQQFHNAILQCTRKKATLPHKCTFNCFLTYTHILWRCGAKQKKVMCTTRKSVSQHVGRWTEFKEKPGNKRKVYSKLLSVHAWYMKCLSLLAESLVRDQGQFVQQKWPS